MPLAEMPRAIAFMHIPKTAGTSVIKAFERALGRENCRTMNGSVTDKDFDTHRFISGHQTLSSITPNAWRFTFLREPVAQLASHLRWLDHYNELPFREQAKLLSFDMRHIIVRVGQTDFGSAAALDALFRWLPANSPARLSNVQSEVLSRRVGGQRLVDPIDLAAAAVFNLRALNFVGLTEYADRDMNRLFRKLSIQSPPQINHDNAISSSRRFDLNDTGVRRALERWMQADLRLYEHVLRRRRAVVIPW